MAAPPYPLLQNECPCPLYAQGTLNASFRLSIVVISFFIFYFTKFNGKLLKDKALQRTLWQEERT